MRLFLATFLFPIDLLSFGNTRLFYRCEMSFLHMQVHMVSCKKTLIIRQTMNDSKPIINLYEHFKHLPADALSPSLSYLPFWCR